MISLNEVSNPDGDTSQLNTVSEALGGTEGCKFGDGFCLCGFV